MKRTKPQAAPPTPQPHSLRSFTGSDGQTYQRRADILMREWRIYTETDITQRVQEQYFVALFLGLVEPDTLLLPWPLRLARSVDVFDDWTFERYFAVRDTIFYDIVNPAAPAPSPKVEASQDADGATTPEA